MRFSRSTPIVEVAQVLALVGIVGIVGESVTRRTREIGVRVALGARALHLSWAVGRESAFTGLVGLAVGVLLLFTLHEWMATAVFEYYVQRLGPAVLSAEVLGLAIGIVSTVTLLASALTARRALRINPVDALRAD